MEKMKFHRITTSLVIALVFFISCQNRPRTGPIVKVEGDYICVSLNNYFKEVNRLVQSGQQVPSEIDSLFGLSWLEGYVIDYEKNDIVLVGKSVKSRPPYHTEDLFVNFQNVFDSTTAPYCSLDPIAKNIVKFNKCFENQSKDFEVTIKACQQAIGGQLVVIGGVPRNSRHAKIMIYADYDMKKISQGLIKDSGVRSCIDFSMQDTVEDSDKEAGKSSMSRFWFHIKEDQNGVVYPNYIENEGIVFIHECPVVVLTEKQIPDAEGNLKDNAQEVDKPAEMFAAEFTLRFSELAAKSFIFAELENLFRLQACFKAMKVKEAIQNSGIDLSCISRFSLSVGENDLPATLPGLINYKLYEKTTEEKEGSLIRKGMYLVAGGVSQEMTIKESNLTYDESISKSAAIVLNSRPEETSIFWVTNQH